MYYINKDNIHIVNSYEISKKYYDDMLNAMRRKFNSDVLNHRSNHSLKMELIVSKFLNKKDTYLKYPQPLYKEILYNILGIFFWIFVK